MTLVAIERSIASNSSHSRHRATPQQYMLFERCIAGCTQHHSQYRKQQWTENTSRRFSCKLARNSCALHHLQHRKHQCKQLLRVASFAKSHEPMRAISLVHLSQYTTFHTTQRTTFTQHWIFLSDTLCNKYTVGRGTTEISRPNPSIELGLELQTLFTYLFIHLFIHLHLTRERK